MIQSMGDLEIFHSTLIIKDDFRSRDLGASANKHIS